MSRQASGIRSSNRFGSQIGASSYRSSSRRRRLASNRFNERDSANPRIWVDGNDLTPCRLHKTSASSGSASAGIKDDVLTRRGTELDSTTSGISQSVWRMGSVGEIDYSSSIISEASNMDDSISEYELTKHVRTYRNISSNDVLNQAGPTFSTQPQQQSNVTINSQHPIEQSGDLKQEPLVEALDHQKEYDIDHYVTVELTETASFDLFVLAGNYTSDDNGQVDRGNECIDKQKYFKHKDVAVCSSAQSQTYLRKNKEVQVIPPRQKDVSCQASSFDIYDSRNAASNLETNGAYNSHITSEEKSGENAGNEYSNDVSKEVIQVHKKAVTQEYPTKAIRKALRTVERALIQNVEHFKQTEYKSECNSSKCVETLNKDCDDDDDEITVGETHRVVTRNQNPSLSFLWKFNYSLTGISEVTCMTWNHKNMDLLACGYGNSNLGSPNREGMILLWTFKNSQCPEYIIKTESGITALDFSECQPHLLAAGFSDGSVAVYDIRQRIQKPILKSECRKKHRKSVWSIKWLKLSNSDQGMITVSSDGHVKQWIMKKEFTSNDILALKGGALSTDKFTTKQARCLSLDVSVHNAMEYFLGTESGDIHKCFVSNTEQVLNSYLGHKGAVYQVQCSPFDPSTFISCSEDWTIKLWSQNSSKPLLTFQSGHEYFTDICWSPTNSCVFAAVTRDGQLKIWDLTKSTLDPVVVMVAVPQDQKSLTVQLHRRGFNCVMFAPRKSVILTGSTDGVVEVHRIYGIEQSYSSSPAEQQTKLRELIHKDQEF